MHDPSGINQELLEENALLKQIIRELKIVEAERKRANDALRESEDKYRILLSESPDPTFSFTPEGQYRYVNRAFAEGVGKPVEDIIGKSIWDVFPKEEADKRFASLSQVFRTGEEKVIEVRVPRADGDRYYMTTITPIKDRKGKMLSALCSSKDITGRKRAEEALQERERSYRALAENLPGIVYRVHIREKDRMQFFNNMLVTLTGYNEENLIEGDVCSIDPLIVVEDRNRIVAEVKAAIKDRRGFSVEYRITHKDGTPRFFIERGRPIFDNEGLNCIDGIILDITERKRAEEALTISEAKFRKEQKFHQLLLDTSPAFIVAIGFDGKTLMMNQALLNALEYTAEEIKGTDYLITFVPEEDRVRLAGVFRQIVREGKATVNENRIRSRSGRTYLVEWHSQPVIQEGGNIDFFVGVGIDITAHKQAETEMRESERKYRALIETTNTGFVIIDPDGLVIDANPEYVGLTGHQDLSEIIGRSAIEWTADYEKEKNAMAIRECFQRGYIRNLQIDYMDSKGNITPLELNATCMEIEGKTQILTICRDIAERKRAEKLLRESEERLQRAEKMEALGTLAGGVAHDLNNVLGVVVGYAELLLNSVDKSSPIIPRIMNIMKGGEQAAAIVQDLLTLARRGVSSRHVVNLNNMIIDAQQSPEFANLSSHHPFMRIKTDLDPELLNIAGSPVHLGKTLYNLAANAGEAMPNGGVLTIKTANQYLDKPIQGYDEVREGDYVVLSVSDTGEGIPAADLKRIFEPFYTKKVMGRSGTGLGLAVVWGTMKDHNGYINVQSEEGKGSSFTLYFPVTRGKVADEHVAVAVSEYMGKGEAILVVDDVRGQRDLATEMLRDLNYRVESVASGEEAVAYLREHEVDLMVLDMIMDPGMDGLDTYRRALKIRPQQKAIIVSGFSETYRVNAAQALGAGAYVRKPYLVEKLGLAVRKELDRTTRNPEDQSSPVQPAIITDTLHGKIEY